MTISLSVPPAIVQEVRSYAEKEGTSLNELIRGYLQDTAERSRREREASARKAFDFLMSQDNGKLPCGWKFNRDEANARG